MGYSREWPLATEIKGPKGDPPTVARVLLIGAKGPGATRWPWYA